MNCFMGLLLTFLIASPSMAAKPQKQGRHIIDRDPLGRERDSWYDPDFNYSSFPARVTDRDKSGNVLKVWSESGNVRFFRAGDQVSFQIPSKRKDNECEGYVRSVERHYFVMYVKDFYPCWGKGEYFRRGTILDLHSVDLAKRVREASLYRYVLIKRRKDFLRQLNEINHFVWSYDQQKVKLASEYDKRISDIEKKKQRSLSNLLNKKRDQILLQKELAGKLDELDQDIGFYRIEKNELLVDRWHSDLDLGQPVKNRPQALKQVK